MEILEFKNKILKFLKKSIDVLNSFEMTKKKKKLNLKIYPQKLSNLNNKEKNILKKQSLRICEQYQMIYL